MNVFFLQTPIGSKPQPLDTAFNVAVLSVANRLFPSGFDVSDDAPETYEALTARLNAGERMAVWSGASDQTIYADREVNYAFRAWYGWCHWRGRHRFTLEGERAVHQMQCNHIRRLYGDSEQTHRWFLLLEAEVVGQFLYKQVHGNYPEDQRAFVLSYLSERHRPTRLAAEE